MKLFAYALLGLLVLELLFVAPGYAGDAEGQQASEASKSSAKKLKKKSVSKGGQPKIRRTIRVHESSPPLAPAITPEPQPQAQASRLPPTGNIELNNAGPNNQVEVKPEISVSMAPAPSQPQPLQSKKDEDEPVKVVESSAPGNEEPKSPPASPVQVSQEQNVVQMTPGASKDEAEEKPKKDKKDSLELDGVGNQKSTKISNSGNREQVEIEDSGNEKKKIAAKKDKKKAKKAKKACKHPSHNGDEVYHEHDHEHFQGDDDGHDDEHEHYGDDCKHPSHKKDKKKDVKKDKKKDKKKVEQTNIQIHINNNGNGGSSEPAVATTMRQDEQRLPAMASNGLGAKFVVPVINDAHLSQAVMRGQPQEIQAALAMVQTAPRQFMLVEPTPAGTYLAQPLFLQSPPPPPQQQPQFPVIAAPPMQMAPQPMTQPLVQPLMQPMVVQPHPMLHHPAAAMIVPSVMPAARMMMSPVPMVPSYIHPGAMMATHPAMFGPSMPWVMQPMEPGMDKKRKKNKKDKKDKKDKKGKKDKKKEGKKEMKDKGKKDEDGKEDKEKEKDKEEEQVTTTTTETPTTKGPYLDNLVRQAVASPVLEPVRQAERYLPAVSLPSIPGMPQLPPATPASPTSPEDEKP